jgi:hypothetical protein
MLSVAKVVALNVEAVGAIRKFDDPPAAWTQWRNAGIQAHSTLHDKEPGKRGQVRLVMSIRLA